MSEEGEKTGLITVCPPSGERSYPRLLYLAEPLAKRVGLEPTHPFGLLAIFKTAALPVRLTPPCAELFPAVNLAFQALFRDFSHSRIVHLSQGL